jgi:hypothetical protein
MCYFCPINYSPEKIWCRPSIVEAAHVRDGATVKRNEELGYPKLTAGLSEFCSYLEAPPPNQKNIPCIMRIFLFSAKN